MSVADGGGGALPEDAGGALTPGSDDLSRSSREEEEHRLRGLFVELRRYLCGNRARAADLVAATVVALVTWRWWARFLP